MINNVELFFKIIITTGTFFLAYHRYTLSLFEKKIDKGECEKERIFAGSKG